MIISSPFLRICLLIAAFQIYITLCSLLFQKTEGHVVSTERSDKDLKKLIQYIMRIPEIRLQNISMEQLRKTVKNDKRIHNKRLFSELDNSYLFTLLSFTTLGNSGLTLETWQARLLYIFTIPFGFALYIVIIISLAYHLRSIMQTCVTSLQNKHENKIELLNVKILIISLMTTIGFLQIGGIVMTVKGDGYLYGLYASLDSMAFVGNEIVFQDEEKLKLYFLFLFSFYLMLMHCILLVFISSCCHAWKEISDHMASSEKRLNCFESQKQILDPDYREKLLASFDSSISDTPSNENIVEDEAYFPQYKEINMLYDSGLEDPFSVERIDRRFSELFNAQKNNFEPIQERNEASDENFSNDSTDDDDISDFSSVKSNEEFTENNSTLKKLDEESLSRKISIDSPNFEQMADELQIVDGMKQRMSSPCGSSPSLPSSYSNISLDDWDNEEGERKDQTLRRLSSLDDLEMTSFDDSDATLTLQ